MGAEIRLLYGRICSKSTWLATLLALPILLAACGGGVSQEEFDAAQAQAAALQQRLDRGAAIQVVLDILLGSFGDEDGAPSAEDFLEFSAVIQASGTPELQAKWLEIIDSVLASAGPIPQEVVSQVADAVEASGNAQVAEKWQEFLAVAATGEGGAAFLELGALTQASGDPALQGLLLEIIEATLAKGEPPGELFGEFNASVLASANVELRDAFGRFSGPPPELLEEIGAKLQALEDPNLDALFEAVSQSPSPETFDAFFEGLLAGLRETLK